jgi:hypothetical protein
METEDGDKKNRKDGGEGGEGGVEKTVKQKDMER